MGSFTGAGTTSSPPYKVSNVLQTRYTGPTALQNGSLLTAFNSALDTLTGGSTAYLTNYVTGANFSGLNRIPTNIDSFISGFLSYFNAHFPPNPNMTAAKAKQALENTILGYTGIDVAALDGSLFGDSSSTSVSTAAGVTSSQLQTDIGDRAFSDFLANFSYPANPSTVITSSVFETQLNQYFFHMATSIHPDTTQVSVTTGTGIAPAGTEPLNFEDIYNAFFPASQANFQETLGLYLKNVLFSNGSTAAFLPSNNIGSWIDYVSNSYEQALKGSPVGQSELAASFTKVSILNAIFNLVVEIVGTLQHVAASQSQNLQVQTNQEQAYTTLQTEVPTFIQNDGSFLGNNSSVRDQANKLTQALTSSISAKASIVQDSAKQTQSNINTSNDDANQQANMGTAIIQELSTILSAIYR
jgi:hypothetical protein